MLIQIQQRSYRVDEQLFLGETLNLGMCSNFGEILRKIWEILGKYRIPGTNSWGLKG